MANVELTRRAVAAKGWRWMPGMRLVTLSSLATVRLHAADEPFAEWPGFESDWLPDLDDPATLGCLLALVREAWGDGEALGIAAHAMPLIDRDGLVAMWHVWIDENFMDSRMVGRGVTETEALVAALEAAPGKEMHRGQ